MTFQWKTKKRKKKITSCTCVTRYILHTYKVSQKKKKKRKLFIDILIKVIAAIYVLHQNSHEI